MPFSLIVPGLYQQKVGIKTTSCIRKAWEYGASEKVTLVWEYCRMKMHVAPPVSRRGRKYPNTLITLTSDLWPWPMTFTLCDLYIDLWPMILNLIFMTLTLVTLTLDHLFWYSAENWYFYIFDLGNLELWPWPSNSFKVWWSLMCALNSRSVGPTVQPSACKQMDTQTDRRMLLKILPLPLTWELIRFFFIYIRFIYRDLHSGITAHQGAYLYKNINKCLNARY